VGNQTVCALEGTQSSKDLPRVSTLLHDIRAAVPDDAFVGDVLQAELDSDDNCYQDFPSTTTTFFDFVEVKMWYPESVYQLNVREQFCEQLTVTVFLRVTRRSARSWLSSTTSARHLAPTLVGEKGAAP